MAVPKRKKKNQKIIKPFKIGLFYRAHLRRKISKEVIELTKGMYNVYKTKVIKNSSYLKLKRTQKKIWYSMDELTKHLEKPKKLFSGTKQEKMHNRYLRKRIDKQKKQRSSYLSVCMYKKNFWRTHLYNTVKSEHYDYNMNRREAARSVRTKKRPIVASYPTDTNKLNLFL